jgi:hypothetical protein
MMQPPIPAPAAPPRPLGPRLLTSFIVMGVGIVLGIVAAVAIVIPLAGSFTSPVYEAPGSFQMHLHHATYTVYQHTETRSVFGSVQRDVPLVRITPSNLTVTAPDGTIVPVSFTTDVETLTRRTDVYRGTLVFDAPRGGDYVVRFNNPSPTTVIVSRSILDALRGVWPWFGVGALGGALLITGLVMLIVGATRRGRAKRAMYASWGPPPQWGTPQQQPWGTPPQQWSPPPPPPPGAPPPGSPPQWGPPPAS